MIKRTYTVADFFAGCGGLSYGFSLTRRFDVRLGSDIKPEALKTFVENHGILGNPPAAILGDITELDPDVVVRTLSEQGINAPGDLDCLIGGEPRRVCRRLQLLSRMEHHEQDDEQVLP